MIALHLYPAPSLATHACTPTKPPLHTPYPLFPCSHIIPTINLRLPTLCPPPTHHSHHSPSPSLPLPPTHSYADLYGHHGAMSPAETGGSRAHRVTFGHDTMFRDSLEVAATTTGNREAAEDVRRLPGQAQKGGGGGGGQQAQSAPSRQQQQKAGAGYQDGGGGGCGGNRAAKAVAAAAEEAARLLSGVRIGSRGGGGQPQRKAAAVSSGAVRARPRTAGAQAVQVVGQQGSVMGTAVRYETHIGVGGGVFTFALPSGGGGGAVYTAGANPASVRPGGRSLVSEYMSAGGSTVNGASHTHTQQQAGKVPAPRQDRGRDANGAASSTAVPVGTRREVTAGPRAAAVPAGPPGAAAAMGRHAGGARRALEYSVQEG